RVLTRELPFREGDLYSHRRLTQGQQEIFGLNLFRVALADLPEQPVDSTVTVRYRVRESKLRFITGQTGYSREDGIELNAEWRHRNFFGSARNFSVNARAATGLLARTSGESLAPRQFNVTLSIRQPYLFSSYLSGNVSPFLQFERDKNLLESNEPLGINRRDFGFSTTLIYQRLPFRPFTLAYTFVRSLQFTRTAEEIDVESRDLFNKSVISLNATVGWLNNYLSPRRGYLIRPYVESAGSILGSEVEYVKLGTEVQGFIPITKKISVGVRTQFGRLWPLGKSREALDADDPTFEDRFDPILFYAGGASDVRGWDTGFLGAKTARTASTGSETIVYEPAGGRAKIAMNVELRYPFPGLPSAWRLATFLDAGQVSAQEVEMPDGSTQIVDNGNFRFDDLRFGVGSGVRYRTPVGFIRFDIAFKVNPSDTDLLSPRDAFEGNDNKKFSRRFNFHLSIGQTF
ncbi:MAG: BamA/TamA family outer membrane protein, partial [Rhodothermia bacterium]|nr:BamA/TamA family outer membrane protein [Rhodothermia bacterium]